MKEKLKKIIDRFWFIYDDFDYQHIEEINIQPFLNKTVNFVDKETNESYGYDNHKWVHAEYIKLLKKKIIIEPDYSYCITDFNKVVRSSAFFPKLVPSFPRYIMNFAKRNNEYIPKAILFDGQVGQNYFHFFSDVLSKIWLIQKIDGYQNTPLIIGEKTFKTSYFKYLYENTEIKNYNWYVQKHGKYIVCDEIYLVKPMPYSKAYLEKEKSLLIEKDNDLKRRVFLTRSKKSGRYIENFFEIEPILEKYGFEIVDTANLTLDAQANLFNSIGFLISIHGAGEANIIFAKKNLRFLEINPLNRISCQFYWLSEVLGIDYYDVILGGELPQTRTYPEGGFFLDTKKLEDAIIRLLN